MIAATPPDGATASDGTPKRRTTWRRIVSPHSPQYLARQNRITHLAFVLLGGSAQAITFLNAHNSTLNAKPIDLAGHSAEGYTTVHNELLRLSQTSAAPIS